MSEIQNNRLQLLRHDNLFVTREEALDYIDSNYRPSALIAEPVVVFYGDKTKPNAILAIGAVNNRVFILDATALKEDITANTEKVNDGADGIKELSQSVDEIVKASGLVFDSNKISDRITYTAPVRDEVIGNAKTLAEAIATVSQFAQDHAKDSQFATASSQSITLLENEVKGTRTISAEVNVSTEGADDDAAFNDNIIGIKPDGLFAAVNLRYDEEKRSLVFSCSGMKNGKFVTDAKRQEINLGEHTAIINGNTDENPIKVKVSEKDGKKVISADLKLSEDNNNLIKIQDGALTVEGKAKNIAYKGKTVAKALGDLEETVQILDELDVKVDAATNTLTVTVGGKTKVVSLPGVDIIKNVKYNKSIHQLELTFKNDSTTIIPLDDLFSEYHFANSETVKMHEHSNDDGSVTVYGDVVVSKREDNVLRQDESGLYVLSSEVGVTMRDVTDAVKEAVQTEKERALEAEDTLKESVREEADRAKEAERGLTDSIKESENGLKETIRESENGLKELINEESARAKEAERAAEDSVKAETDRATKREAEIEQLVKDEAIARERADEQSATELREAIAEVNSEHASNVRDEKDRAMAAEAAISSLLDNEIAERRADVKRVETETVPALQQLIIDKIQEEIDRAKEAEHTNAEAIIAEKSRAELRETEIENKVTSATTKADYASAQADAANAAVQTEATRATEKEHILELSVNSTKEAVEKEIADRKEADAIQNANIKEVQDKVALLDGTIAQSGSIRNIISEELRLSNEGLANETARAKTAEETLGQRIDGIVDANSDTLKTAKEYTDAESDRAKEVENNIKVDIQALKDKDTELADAIASKVGDVKVEKVGDNDLVYQLLVDGVPSGLINIPQDHFFQGVDFDDETHILTLRFTTPDEEAQAVNINMSSLMQVYHAGNAIGLDAENNFYIVKNEQGDEGYLFVDENGICVKGINAALATKANVGDSYTKTESDAEYAKLRAEDVALKGDLTLLVNDAKTALNGEIAQVDQKVEAEVVRAKAKEEVIENTVKANKEAADAAILENKTELAAVKAKAENNEKAISDEKARAELVEQSIQNDVDNVAEKVNVLTGTVGTPGSVLDNIQKAKDEVNITIAAEVERAKAEEVRLREAIDTNNTTALAAISDAKNDAIAHTDRELVDVKANIAQNAADIKTKVGTVTLEQPDGGTDYILMVDSVNIGTIRTQQRGGILTGVVYEGGILFLTFNVDGETKTETIDFNTLLNDVKEYSAGDGLALDGTKFRVVKNALSEDFLSITESGIGVYGVNDAIAAGVAPVQAGLDEAKLSIIEINTKLESVKVVAETARDTANNATSIANAATLTAQGAVTTANDAKTIAQTANETAEDAHDMAQEAKDAAAEAKTAAGAAQDTADGISDLVNNAKAAAQAAENVAAQASALANAVQNNLNTTNSNVLALQQKASEMEAEIEAMRDELDNPVVDYGTY